MAAFKEAREGEIVLDLAVLSLVTTVQDFLAAFPHSKRIALSCQTGEASFNAPYRKHHGPTKRGRPGSFHCRGASDTVLGVLGGGALSVIIGFSAGCQSGA